MKTYKTDYPGVFYMVGRRPGKGEREEKIYYIIYRRKGKLINEKVGRQYQDDLTPAKVAGIRSARIEGKDLSNAERRRITREAKEQTNPWTFSRLWDEYSATKEPGRTLTNDISRFNKYLKNYFGKKQPHEIVPLDIDRLKRKDLKDKAPQTIKHALSLLSRLSRFGVNRGLSLPIPFKVEFPKLNNVTTEDLSTHELKNLLNALDESKDTMTANLMKMALCTGMRRGELFKLCWKDIDFEKGFITIRKPKGGKDEVIPLNSPAREVLLNHTRQDGLELVFYRGDGKAFTEISRQAHRIYKSAGITKDFRPLHGLRHHFASALASSGKVDLYVLQRLLTHKSPQMTQRYSHLRDQALRQASDLAGELFKAAEKETGKEEKAEGGEA
jgi:integrase